MPLWGVGTNTEKKPVWLSDEEKERTFADSRGWVIRHPNGDEEVLVAIGNLAGTDASTGLAAPTVERVRFSTTTPTQGDTVYFYVYYNEPVTVVTTGGTPTVPCTVNAVGDTLDFDLSASQLETGRVAFALDTTALTGDIVVAASASIALNGGTITDETDASTAAELTLNNTERTATIQV